MSELKTSSREGLIMKPLIDFYYQDHHRKKLISLVFEKKSKIPMRIYEWFVSNYAKQFGTNYPIISVNSNGQTVTKTFNVYQNYQAQVKSKGKKMFDPYGRGNPITLVYKNPVEGQEDHMIITVKQLNFFKWVIENQIDLYVEQHYQEIDQHLNESMSKPREKHGEITKPFYHQMSVSPDPVVVNF